MLKPRFRLSMGEGKALSMLFKSISSYLQRVGMNLLCRISDCGWLGGNTLTKEGGHIIVVI